jgi:hypothetical protein
MELTNNQSEIAIALRNSEFFKHNPVNGFDLPFMGEQTTNCDSQAALLFQSYTDISRAVAVILDTVHNLRRPEPLADALATIWNSYAILIRAEYDRLLTEAVGDENLAKIKEHEKRQAIINKLLQRIQKKLGRGIRIGDSASNIDVKDILRKVDI